MKFEIEKYFKAKYVVPFFISAASFYIMNKSCYVYRTLTGDVLEKILYILDKPYKLLGLPIISLDSSDFIFPFLIALMIYILIITRRKRNLRSARKLMDEAEVFKLPGEKCILTIRGANPWCSFKYDIEKHPNYKYLKDFDKKNAFDPESYIKKYYKDKYVVICISRMLEIYIYCSISPIPFATLTNREWGSVGTNFVKNMFALAFQAFFMEICLVVFNSLVIGALTTGSSIDGALIECMVVSVMLCFTMFKCGGIAKSIFNAI